MMIRRRRYMGQQFGPLPIGYKLAEYIENTANLCLFTEIYATSELEMRIDYVWAATQGTGYSTITTVKNAYFDPVLTLGYEGSHVFMIRFGSKTYVPTEDSERHVVEWTGKMVYYDGVQVIDGSSESFGPCSYGQANRTIPIFGGRNSAGSIVDPDRSCRARIYALTVNEHEFLPCYGVGEESWGLYDTTAERFLFDKTALTGKLL